MRFLAATIVCLLAFPSALPAQQAGRFKNLRIVGEVAARDGALEVVGKTANLIVDVPDGNYRLNTELMLNPNKGANVMVAVMPQNPVDLLQPGAARLGVKATTGLALQTVSYLPDGEGKGWTALKALPMHFWPNALAKGELAELERLGVKPRTWHGRKLRLVIEVDDRAISFWLEGLLVHQASRPAGSKGPVVFQLSAGDQLHQAAIAPLTRYGLYLPVDLSSLANDKLDGAFAKTSLRMGMIPFEAAAGERNALSLRQAGWSEVRRDPSSYTESYDGGPAYLHDPRMPFLRVPLADYTAAHVLAVADADEGSTNALTLQAGRYGLADQVVQYDFFGQVPRVGQAPGPKKVKNFIDTPAGKLYHVRIPMDIAFAQDLTRFLELTLTKEIRLARRQPDPNRFRYRPLGLPSGVKIAALTLERSPLQIRVSSKAPGHAFEEPTAPTFEVKLRNVTATDQAYTLLTQATHLDGSVTKVEKAGKVPAGEEETVALTVPVKNRGYHDLVVTLANAVKQPLLQRRTSFAVLPPETRKYRHQSPFGTWDFSGGHFTSNDPAIVGTLYAKLGVRFGMFGFPAEERKKYGIVQGSEPVITNGGLSTYEKYRERNPDAPHFALLFHENAISRGHVSRIPDIFHDRPPYKLNESEEKRFKAMWEQASSSAKALRGKYPDAHIRLGNGVPATREEFYRHKFPTELFDSAGNENSSFGRPPETQPPDTVANNATLWMDRQLLDAYGYKDKAVSMCYEVCYPSCNPGNLTLNTQADYLVRHALHALAWGIKEFRPGCISDVGNSYYYSNWGSSGFCNKKPELSVKPAFVAFATMTRVLDGARFVREVPLGSPSVYCMEFDLPGGERAYALWTVRGRRPLTFRMAGENWKLIDDQANEKVLTPGITLSSAPVYVVGKGKLEKAELGEPVYAERPAGKAVVLAPMNSLEEWTIEPGRNAELENYNMMTPRRKGEFVYTSVARVDGKEGALQVKALPLKHGKATMPMYSVLTHKKGLEVPGTPTEMGLWIHGNSGWGRIIYELIDASGQRWISLGAQQRGEPSAWLADWLPKEELAKPGNAGQSDWNTEDVFGVSRINFDGWRYVAFPLPGNYPGERYPWPANSQWRSDKDGVVHYPLTLRKVIVELSEKVLHARTYEPPVRAEIHLRDLTTGQGDTVRVKTVPYEERK